MKECKNEEYAFDWKTIEIEPEENSVLDDETVDKSVNYELANKEIEDDEAFEICVNERTPKKINMTAELLQTAWEFLENASKKMIKIKDKPD